MQYASRSSTTVTGHGGTSIVAAKQLRPVCCGKAHSMSRWGKYLAWGLVLAVVGSLIADTGFRDGREFVGTLGLLTAGIGFLLAQVGVVAWGVTLGTSELRSLLAQRLSAEGQGPSVGQASPRTARVASPSRTQERTSEPGEKEGKVLLALKESPEGLTRSQIEAETDLTAPELRIALRDLRDARLVVEADGRFKTK